VSNNDFEKSVLIEQWPEVRGIGLVVFEDEERPGTVTLAMTGTIGDQVAVTRIDRTDPGARARAISLGEILFDALTVAEATWCEETEE